MKERERERDRTRRISGKKEERNETGEAAARSIVVDEEAKMYVRTYVARWKRWKLEMAM